MSSADLLPVLVDLAEWPYDRTLEESHLRIGIGSRKSLRLDAVGHVDDDHRAGRLAGRVEQGAAGDDLLFAAFEEGQMGGAGRHAQVEAAGTVGVDQNE